MTRDGVTLRPGYIKEEAVAAMLFLMGPSNALGKLRKQDGGAHGFAPSMPPL